MIRPPVVELTAENTDQVVIRVHDGTLLMFPSYLEHSVGANMGDQERTRSGSASASTDVLFLREANEQTALVSRTFGGDS